MTISLPKILAGIALSVLMAAPAMAQGVNARQDRQHHADVAPGSCARLVPDHGALIVNRILIVDESTATRKTGSCSRGRFATAAHWPRRRCARLGRRISAPHRKGSLWRPVQ